MTDNRLPSTGRRLVAHPDDRVGTEAFEIAPPCPGQALVESFPAWSIVLFLDRPSEPLST